MVKAASSYHHIEGPLQRENYVPHDGLVALPELGYILSGIPPLFSEIT